VCSLEGEALDGVSPRVFPNLKRMHKYKNLPLRKGLSFDSLLLSHFVEDKYFHGNVGTYKIGEFPQHNTLRFFCWGRSLKIHIEIEREAFCTTT
jgi:hypothetical protein